MALPCGMHAGLPASLECLVRTHALWGPASKLSSAAEAPSRRLNKHQLRASAFSVVGTR